MTDTTSSPPLDLNPLHLPELPSWWPLSWGWWAMAITMIGLIIASFYYLRWQKKLRLAQKTALHLFELEKETLTPSAAIELLRQAAFCYYPRERVAKLSGDEWYQFLDAQLKHPLFTPKQQQWQQALYQNQTTADHHLELIHDCKTWVEQALPPKRGGRE
ncbi:hypothetical protein BCU68_04020 [Vibrio sp. 10N.286.49.B3]|uniref:DUF4381 domain-containing protein n=1 Tax=Vibrio sp. 10N.286.49.B3 TaxID=1880855 RepID=UPI000C81B83D|nr:DUF4381 domain-containing protein [Vibrio sp. 10N.286.49.B3]PMH43162.1 hypothetical protein BCU68_04020 [Vibrio sp. 10N.286.49.B3]